MTIQTINIGNVVNDGLGDDLRTAFQKVNSNFATLAAETTVTAVNIGDVGTGLFKQRTGANLEFKKLVSGRKMQIVDATDTIVINNDAADAFTRIDTNAGYVVANGSNAGHITVQGGADIDVTAIGNIINVNTVLPVTHILTTFDFGPITGSFETSNQLALAFSNIDFGTITQPAIVNLDCGPIRV